MSTENRYPYLHIEVDPAQAELVSDQLWAFGAQGLEERDASTLLGPADRGRILLVASFATEDDARRTMAKLDVPAKLDFVVGDAWRHEWRKHFEPRKVGKRLWVRPSWREVEVGEDEVVVTIDPGGAFGSGIHETTRLVLAEVEARVQGGEAVLDVGCGSGILAIAALLLGATSAKCIDVDPEAARISLENAEDNGVSEKLTASTEDIEAIEGTYPLVLANIQAPILIGMAEELLARVAEGGTLILSGILEGQHDEVAAAYRNLGGNVEAMPRDGEWRSIVLKR